MNEFLLAEVKSVEGKSPTGEFEAVISAPTLDRDGEVIDTQAFDPLPASIPIHAFHDFGDPVGRAVPRYESDGRLTARGVFASTPRAQEIRQLVTEGVIGHMSVGFMGATRTTSDDGAVHITGAELLEASFVSVPSNRQAALVMAKQHQAKTGILGFDPTSRHGVLFALGGYFNVDEKGAEIILAATEKMRERGKAITEGLVAGITSAANIRREEGMDAGNDKAAIPVIAPAHLIPVTARDVHYAAAVRAAVDTEIETLLAEQDVKSTVTDPEQSPAPRAADTPADVSVARARALTARAHLALTQ